MDGSDALISEGLEEGAHLFGGGVAPEDAPTLDLSNRHMRQAAIADFGEEASGRFGDF